MGEVWWETSQRKDPSREVALSWSGSGVDVKPSILARVESMKHALAPESTKTGGWMGVPEIMKETVMVGG